MRVKIKNLGVIRQAEFSLGDLTIICGANNSGKTYAMHATYGFFDYLRSNPEFPVSPDILDRLFNEGSVVLSLDPYVENITKHLDIAAKEYSKLLFSVFAGNETQFANATLSFALETSGQFIFSKVESEFGSPEKGILKMKSSEERNSLSISLLVEKTSEDAPPRYIVQDVISNGIGKAVLEQLIPRPFLSSAERTGAAIFQKELDFTRNRLVEMLGDKSAKLRPLQFLGKFAGEYPLAVRRNVDFIREISDTTHRKSFISQDHPQLLESFGDIIGGEYKVSKDGEVHYAPFSNKRTKLSLVESSSAVRSLLDIGFYLRHVAKPGDLLMIDEPELNLHPENQRKIARLFARLINIGVKVFITTHSDYIVKELNTLIILHQQNQRLRKLAEREGYDVAELLDPAKVRVYIAERASIKIDDACRKMACHTLIPADIDPASGIEVRTFDRTIESENGLPYAHSCGYRPCVRDRGSHFRQDHRNDEPHPGRDHLGRRR